MAKKLFINGNKDCIPYSDKMECNYDSKDITLEIYIKFPMENMQEDYANFEAIAFSVWSIAPNVKVVLKFDHSDWGDKFPLPNYIDSQNKKRVSSYYQHYMRFLYRAYKMRSLYKNFTIYKENVSEVDLFENLFKGAKSSNSLCITVPKSKSSVKDQDKITENHIEKWFVIKSRDENNTNTEVNKLKSQTNVGYLYDQFPCGLFYDVNTPSEEKRIFNTGYFDLWGIDENNDICLFELKKPGNTKLGIISELFFYSCLAKDFKDIGKPNDRKKVRGYNVFMNANKKIKAYFLVPEFHSFIDNHIDSIIKVMNKRADGVEYDYIKFNYENISKDDSMISIKKEWGNFKY